MKITTTDIKVTTHAGRRLTIKHIQHWIDTSSKDDPSGRERGMVKLRTIDGSPIEFDGSVFKLSDGDTFDPPSG